MGPPRLIADLRYITVTGDGSAMVRPGPARPGSAAVGRVVRGEQAGGGVVGVGRGRHAKRLEQLVEVEPDLGRERPERADAPGRGSLRLGGHARRLGPAGLDTVASVEHV